MSISNQLLSRIKERFPPETWMKFPIIVAVSGGADSVALLRLLVLLNHDPSSGQNQRLMVAHVNHGLRGDQSDLDEEFVQQLADDLGLKFFSTKLPSQTLSSEEILRNQRYDFLVQLAHDTGARLIATGHTANDQAETILFRILRGTGIGGLGGIQPVRAVDSTVSMIRPLLEIKRTEIERVLDELGQPFRTDLTNTQSDYTRNYLRNELMPVLESRFEGRVFDSLIRLGLQAAETESFLNEQMLPLFESMVEESRDHVRIDLKSLGQHAPILIRQFFKTVWAKQNWPLKAMTYENWKHLAMLARQSSGFAATFPGGILCRVEGERLLLTRESQNDRQIKKNS